jgi:putative transposase
MDRDPTTTSAVRWRHAEAVEFATRRWVDWFDNRRLLEPIGHVPPAEYEALYYESTRVA